MPVTDVSLPDRLDSELDRLVEQGDFINRDQAVEELLTLGLSAYSTDESGDEEALGDVFNQAIEDQRDPAMLDEDDSQPL